MVGEIALVIDVKTAGSNHAQRQRMVVIRHPEGGGRMEDIRCKGGSMPASGGMNGAGVIKCGEGKSIGSVYNKT